MQPFYFVFLLLPSVLAVNFDWERIQLAPSETFNDASIRFGIAGQPSTLQQQECRAIPRDSGWPSENDWARFNETLGGVLLKPKPLATPCYTGPEYDEKICTQLRSTWSSNLVHADDPTSIVSQWPTGNACVPTLNPNSTCSQGGFPVYVVNATTIRHIQLAVNFARNQNIRLVIKNSGLDYNGKSIGGSALSIWVHHLRDARYHANYSTPSYTGRAVAYSAGTQSMDGSILAIQNNITMILAGGSTVGIAGGFLQGGGHSGYSSIYGLAADNVLRITAVTADGHVVEASEGENDDLFWAFRGGGGGTYGVITSVVVKAFPQTPMARGSITFSTVPTSGAKNDTSVSTETFWNGVQAYWEYCIKLCDAGGLGYNFIRHTPHPLNSSITGFTFTTSISLPNRSFAEYRAFIRPLLERLNELGIAVPLPPLNRRSLAVFHDLSPNSEDGPGHLAQPPSLKPRMIGDVVSQTLIASRLFLRSNFDTPEAISETSSAIRSFVSEGGYDVHGQNYSPTLPVAGNPDNAVNPPFRETIMHTQGYERDAHWDGKQAIVPYPAFKERHDRLMQYMQKWRDITPGSGSYMNEGDMQEPDWKGSFYGSNYERLAAVKRRWDPEGVFWAISAVGSDGWEMRGSSGGGRQGVFTQDGRLCKVG